MPDFCFIPKRDRSVEQIAEQGTTRASLRRLITQVAGLHSPTLNEQAGSFGSYAVRSSRWKGAIFIDRTEAISILAEAESMLRRDGGKPVEALSNTIQRLKNGGP